MLFFYLLIGLIIFQRLVELVIAKKNEVWLKARGAYEVGRGHYKIIVLLHICFLFSLLIEVRFSAEGAGGGGGPAAWWWIPLGLFALAQIVRVWSIVSLGRYWNTRIMVLPGVPIVRKGPYRFCKHPNYGVVATEILVVPLIFQAYWTAVLFTVLNAVVLLGIRIPAEERALQEEMHPKRIFKPKNSL